jgi:glucan 1,3-beta-glucosidase
VFVAGFLGGSGRAAPPYIWAVVTANALAGGLTIGWTIANVPIESLYVSGWIKSLAFAAVAVSAAPVLSFAAAHGTPLPRFSDLLGPAPQRSRDLLTTLMGAIAMATMLLALIVALGLVFDPRYRDFPFAPLTAAAVPLLVHAFCVRSQAAQRGHAELAGAAVLALSVPYILFNESLANWQSLWLCAALAAIAVSLVPARGALN